MYWFKDSSRYASFVVGVACMLATGGCGGERPVAVKTDMVEGVITLDGQPLPGATVTFLPVQAGTGASATGMSDPTGKYTLTAVGAGRGAESGAGTLPGEYYVGVLKDDFPDLAALEEDRTSGDEAAAEIKVVHVVPESYNEPRTSNIKVTVKAGDNNIPIELKSK